ncbi:MAG TPA: alpha/beta hydrolase [Candidatus Dormibacteraeota bacterium]|nr:alpha/beta hydrolase [Candidatus Dormibacteraeota bacterium]
MARVKVNGVQLYYEQAGAGDPLVMVHGSWLDHGDWDLVVSRLSGSFRVVTYDRRGHSNSEASPHQGSFDEDAADLAGLIEALDCAPAHLVGHSSGAIIALLLATTRPELVRTLNLHEPPLFDLVAGDPEVQPLLAPVGAALGAVRQKLEQDDHRAAARQFADEVSFGPGSWNGVLTSEARERMIQNAPTFLDELRQPVRLRVDLDRLGHFDRPVLLTEGAESPRLRGLCMGGLARALPQAERRVLVGTAHLPHVTDPERYALLIEEFALRGSR